MSLNLLEKSAKKDLKNVLNFCLESLYEPFSRKVVG